MKAVGYGVDGDTGKNQAQPILASPVSTTSASNAGAKVKITSSRGGGECHGPVAWDCRDRSWLVQEGKEEEMVEGGIRLGSGRNRQVVPRST